MQLTDEQKTKVAQWIADGMKLSDIQSRMGTEFDLRMTYMEARMLVDDLKLLPKDPEEPAKPAAPEEDAAAHVAESPVADPAQAAAAGQVTLSSDTLARPGAMASGKVTFSDGEQAVWYIDQFSGQLGMVPPFPGFKPSQEDVRQFQVLLERELGRLGM
ncbi:MAG: hypothetical protein DVB28_001990 [Verrucomicrobia bacterium]|nr:MAG: hypothetical protein DVB28_001990 [Verrucomicrobiota bacterium]